MPNRAFLDSNVFIFGFERPRSNSRRILNFLAAGGFHGVVTDRIVQEVMRYFRRHHGKDRAAQFRDFILLTCEFVLEADLEVGPDLAKLVGSRDAGAVAATRAVGPTVLVSTDSDFEGLPEHRTPREFLGELGQSTYAGDE